MFYLLWAAADYQNTPDGFWIIVSMATQSYYGPCGRYTITPNQAREVGYALSTSFNGTLPSVPKGYSCEKRGNNYYFYGGDAGGEMAELRNIQTNSDGSIDVDLYEGLDNWDPGWKPYCRFHLVHNKYINRQSVHPWPYSIADYKYLD